MAAAAVEARLLEQASAALFRQAAEPGPKHGLSARNASGFRGVLSAILDQADARDVDLLVVAREVRIALADCSL